LIRIFTLLFFIVTVLFSQNTLLIKHDGDSFSNFNVKIFEDKNNSLTIKQIQDIHTFEPKTNRISNGYSQSSFWVTFAINNQTKTPQHYFLQFTENFIDKLECYVVSNDGSYIYYHEGPGFFKETQVNTLKKPLFPINIQSNETKTIYLKMFSLFPHMIAFNLLNKETTHNVTLMHNTLYALYFGAVIALILYNFFIFIFSRNIAYLYYILYATGFLSWQMKLNGFFPFNTFYSTSHYYLYGLLTPFFIAFLIFFTREVLDTKKLFPKIDKIIFALGFIYLLLTFTSIFDVHKSIVVTTGLVPFVLPFLLLIGFKSYFAGNKTALFYIVAQILFLTTSIMFSMTTNGHLENTLITRHGLVLGSIVEMILFSLALAYKIRELQNDKITLINQSNEKLNTRVKERTHELEASKEEFRLLASQDFMTKLYNRRCFFEMSSTYLERAKNTQNPLSIVLFDIDKFKDVNDTYGHAVGDQVIIHFANILKEIEGEVIASRIGGEEFVLLLENCNSQKAFKIADTIRKTVASQLIPIGNNTSLSYTISAGICSVDLESDTQIDTTLHCADKYLYKAKREGRNIVIKS